MLKVGIICPLKLEYNACKNIFNFQVEKIISNRNVLYGNINEIDIVVILSGLGKVLSAAATQYLVSVENCNFIIDSGLAGSLTDEVKINDVIFNTIAYECDFPANINRPSFNLNRFIAKCTYITSFFNALNNENFKDLFNDFIKSVSEKHNINIKIGTCASYEKNICTNEEKNKIYNIYKSLCCSWESASIIKIANLCNVKSLSVRCISDLANENLLDDFKKSSVNSAHNLYLVLKLFIENKLMSMI